MKSQVKIPEIQSLEVVRTTVIDTQSVSACTTCLRVLCQEVRENHG